KAAIGGAMVTGIASAGAMIGMMLALLALIGVLYLVIRTLIEGADIGQLIKMLGLGYWLSLAASVLLVLYNPRKA
ncbi:MAG: hypothetical protein WBC81_15015, partial [Chitinophagaceae bacterium]